MLLLFRSTMTSEGFSSGFSAILAAISFSVFTNSTLTFSLRPTSWILARKNSQRLQIPTVDSSESYHRTHRLHRHLTPFSKRSDRTDRQAAVWQWNIKNQCSLNLSPFYLSLERAICGKKTAKIFSGVLVKRLCRRLISEGIIFQPICVDQTGPSPSPKPALIRRVSGEW